MIATILVADDDPMARELLTEWLDGEEFRVEMAADGQEALEKATEIVPDLILLDVMMPGMDGYQVCRRLRQDPRVAEVPVIMLTALSAREARLKGLEAGADDFLIKPYDGAELRARVRTIARLNRYRLLLSERAKFEWTVEQSENGYVLLAGDDRIVYANTSSRLFLGRLSPDREPIEEPFLELAREQYRLEPAEAWTSWPRPSVTPRYLVRPEIPTAGAFWLRLKVLELPEGHDARYLVRLRDETSKVALKKDMWKFSSLVSHKLRTPLTTILGGLEMVGEKLEECDRDETAELISMATDGARRLQGEITRVLETLNVSDLASSDRPGFELAQLDALVDDVAEALELAEVSKQIEVDGGGRLSLAQVPFELVLREILENAKKFHPKRAPSVQVRASVAGGALRLVVSDDGMNVPQELLARVWAPYFQSEKGFSGSVDGMGLGLSVVASLVWGVGGSCRIYNREEGPGIVVELILPLLR